MGSLRAIFYIERIALILTVMFLFLDICIVPCCTAGKERCGIVAHFVIGYFGPVYYHDGPLRNFYFCIEKLVDNCTLLYY